MKKPEVREFVEFYLEHADKLSARGGFLPLSDTEYIEALAKIR